MSEREARALAAGEHFTVNEIEYTLRPVRAQQLCDLERDALRHYKKEYLATFVENKELLGDDYQVKIDAQIEKAARWDLDDLPQKDAYDIRHVNVGTWEKDETTDEMTFTVKPEISKWLSDHHEDYNESEGSVRALLIFDLDSGTLTVSDFERITGDRPNKGRVRYDQWWVTASMEGQVSFITNSINSNGSGKKVSRSEIKEWPFAKLTEAARIVEHLTMAMVVNM